MVEGLGKRLWLGCDGCQNTVMIAPRELADRHGLDMHTPLQTLSRALRCTRCGEGRGKAGLSRTATGPGVDRKNGPSVLLSDGVRAQAFAGAETRQGRRSTTAPLEAQSNPITAKTDSAVHDFRDTEERLSVDNL